MNPGRLEEREYHPQMLCENTRRQGMGNRIKNIASCIRMAGTQEVCWSRDESGVNWTTKDVDYYFPDLIPVPNVEGRIYRRSWRLAVYPREVASNFSTIGDRWARGIGTPLGPVVPDKSTVDLEYNRTPESVKADYRKIFANLRLNEEILDYVDSNLDGFTSDTISVHMRTWEGGNRAHFYNLKKYTRILDKYPDRKIFVTSDSQKAVQDLREVYGNRVMTHTIAPDKEHLSAIADILLLANGSQLVVSPFSTFGECAWWFSGATIEVETAW